MVRRRIEIQPIEDKGKRHTTFTKRRQGLEKKAKELCIKCDAEAAVITFSKAGNCFASSHVSVDEVVERYFAETKDKGEGEGGVGTVSDDDDIGTTAPPSMTEAEKRIREAIENNGWEGAVWNLGLGELDELAAEMKMIKSMVAAEIKARGENIPVGGESSRGCC